jgi:hypothetical protein
MKKLDLGQVITISANVGVIIGIFFLVIEVRQNNLLMMSQTRSQISQSISNLLISQAQSPYLEDLVPPERLARFSSIGELRFNRIELGIFRIWENIYYQWERGLYEDSEFQSEREIWRGDINIPSIGQIFCDNRDGFSVGFVEEMETLMDEPCS